jgi:hypothetical protein
MTLEDIVSKLQGTVKEYSHLRCHWEFSRSGCDPSFGYSPSNSQYLHVEGDYDEHLTFRVSDHAAPFGSNPDYELIAGCTCADAELILESFTDSLDEMEPFDPAKSEHALVEQWKAEADAALANKSTDDLRSEIKELVDWRFEDGGFRSLADELAQAAKITLREIDGNDSQLQEAVMALWKKEIVEYTLIEIDVIDDGLRYYRALEFVRGFDDTRLLDERSEYGNRNARNGLRRRDWGKKYLCQQLEVDNIPTYEDAPRDWLRERITSAIEFLGECVQDLGDDLKATIRR